MLPVVAIVGRPNVGKSSLFNRLAGRRHAIESPVSGTTRDQISKLVRLSKHNILLIDTGGLEIGNEGDIEKDVQAQANAAIAGADVVILVVDVRFDPTADDFHAAELLRKSGKPCLMVANKCDHLGRLEEKTFNFFELGFDQPIAVSAIQAIGLDELREGIEQQVSALGFPALNDKITPNKGIRLGFVGRPNVGKSSLINALFGKKKVIVSEIPGTTRDAVEVPFSYNNDDFILIDTAGVRRRGKIEKGIEKYSVMRSFQAIEDSDIVVLVLDGSDGIRAQDLHVVEFILEQYKGLIVAINKVDTFDDFDQSRRRFENILRHRMAFVPWAPVVFVSALEKRNLFTILDLAIQIEQERIKKIPDQELQAWLNETVAKHVPAGNRGNRQAELIGIKQRGNKPPTFVFQAKNAEYFHFSYKRFLENQFREKFGFIGTGIKMVFDRSYL
ncbi:MAG: GTP-binding protein EngA, GTP-binding protein [Candidatus Peregrinibacteria bacterium GW2011_GWF2_39_17]|nr:MAG: GTP-binding protein EngA, GTP-binding protein [Candidatus Peregrinibacteria bacterium GW2011_GWF2_39_17]